MQDADGLFVLRADLGKKETAARQRRAEPLGGVLFPIPHLARRIDPGEFGALMASQVSGYTTKELSKKTLPDFERLFETHPAPGAYPCWCMHNHRPGHLPESKKLPTVAIVGVGAGGPILNSEKSCLKLRGSD